MQLKNCWLGFVAKATPLAPTNCPRQLLNIKRQKRWKIISNLAHIPIEFINTLESFCFRRCFIFYKNVHTAFMNRQIMDGNTAASYVSYAFSELMLIYPITPSSPMAELADEWQAVDKENLFNQVPKVVQMQSESGVAGALHGALTCGALATTYTCSQGLLLMQPNMFKIAGELLPCVFHVSARALSTHALSIFGDHQDVMACRQTGFAMIASSSVQECMDLALVAHLATLKTSIPFLHFFDGFRTSHELSTIETISYDHIKSLVDSADIEKFRARALTPDTPTARGTTQNGDVYFQNRERANERYLSAPDIVQNIMDKVAVLTKRAYHVFDYYGVSTATRVIVLMGSSAQTARETVDLLNENGENVGVIIVRLYRPFDGEKFCNCLPKTCQKIAILDRTKEAGCLGEPLYLDVCAALREFDRQDVIAVGGRYGLASKEFTPAMCHAVFENLRAPIPKNHFTVGIEDDITHTSLPIDTKFQLTHDCTSCLFYGLGSDGTVGANKNSIRILGNYANLHAQGYFVYDSKKSGGATISHLRFGKTPIHAPYLIDKADFLACHNPSYLTRYDMLSHVKAGGVFLLNCPHTDLDTLDKFLPEHVKHSIAEKALRFYVIDATSIAREVGLKGKTSTIMQAAFFILHENLIPYTEAVRYLKEDISRRFSKKGDTMVEMNHLAIDKTSEALQEISYPAEWKNTFDSPSPIHCESDYAEKFIQPILQLKGDALPVSAFQADGTVPTATTQYEDKGLALTLPKWIAKNCIQCNQCAFVCPHATIRSFLTDQEVPTAFETLPAIGMPNMRFRIQIVPRHCMGCGVCAETCPAKEKALVMRPALELFDAEEENWQFAETLPHVNTPFKRNTVKGNQFYPPLFEFSYACAGCGETPYIKVLTQLFGENMLIANATGCSSIYGGSAPTCPYSKNHEGKGPAWANSLFEDNAEFGYGMHLA
ncbi:MAG: pyruvate:ferredoxin (flavodoxin) oxidoreductase, partial [Clostridiales bacterium]|nr:pyruvate:ferredoxin (flavodoxin) oxidoreductase [Clostridiales bacterium]